MAVFGDRLARLTCDGPMTLTKQRLSEQRLSRLADKWKGGEGGASERVICIVANQSLAGWGRSSSWLPAYTVTPGKWGVEGRIPCGSFLGAFARGAITIAAGMGPVDFLFHW